MRATEFAALRQGRRRPRPVRPGSKLNPARNAFHAFLTMNVEPGAADKKTPWRRGMSRRKTATKCRVVTRRVRGRGRCPRADDAMSLD